MTTHEKLIKKWTACEFGVKQRVFNDVMPQTSVQYILKTPGYNDESKMLQLISCIEKHAKELLSEAIEMNKQIQQL